MMDRYEFSLDREAKWLTIIHRDSGTVLAQISYGKLHPFAVAVMVCSVTCHLFGVNFYDYFTPKPDVLP